VSNIRAIAREAGVSIATVSRVLNNLPGVSEASRDAVLDAVQRTGYVPEVGRRSTSNIALVYTAEVSLGSPFDAALVNGIFAGLDGSGADLLVLSVRRSRQPGETVTQMLVRKGAQGALLRATAASQGLCQEAAAEGAAILVVGSRAPAEVSCIYSDSRTGSREAIDHLLDLGHRRVAFGTHRIMDSDHVDRLEGSREALAARGVPWEESRVIHTTADRAGGAQVVRRVALMTPRPTAIYLADPLMVIGAYEEARTVGLEVPRDLSIIGFDDGELRHAVSPRLTAVCQDTIGLGRAAATLLLDRIARRPGKPQQEARRCWFEIHESTAPPGSPTG
jgi:DNA-binding LacI/PurR family transcriptional regulator